MSVRLSLLRAERTTCSVLNTRLSTPAGHAAAFAFAAELGARGRIMQPADEQQLQQFMVSC